MGEPRPDTGVRVVGERRSGMVRKLVASGRYGATGKRCRERCLNLTRGARRPVRAKAMGGCRWAGDEGELATLIAIRRSRARALERAPRRQAECEGRPAGWEV